MSNSSNLHQEFKEDYEVLKKEADLFHILFVDIVKDGARTRDIPIVHMYTGKEWGAMKRNIDKLGINITGHKEYSVLHDPDEAVKKAAEAEKQKQIDAAKKKEEAKVKAAEEKKAKADKIAADKKAAGENK